MIDEIRKADAGWTLGSIVASTFFLCFFIFHLARVIAFHGINGARTELKLRIDELSLAVSDACLVLGTAKASGVFFELWYMPEISLLQALGASLLAFGYYFIISLVVRAFYVRPQRFYLRRI